MPTYGLKFWNLGGQKNFKTFWHLKNPKKIGTFWPSKQPIGDLFKNPNQGV